MLINGLLTVFPKIGKAGIWDLGPHISTSHNPLSKVFIYRTKHRGKAANLRLWPQNLFLVSYHGRLDWIMCEPH